MSTDTSFRDLVARLNAMNNVTPEEERAQLMEAAGKAPKVLDDKEAEDKSDEKDDDGEVPMLDKDFDEGEEVELDMPAEDKFTNDLDPAEKK